MRVSNTVIVSVLFALLAVYSAEPARSQAVPKASAGVHRIVFLGDSITWAGGYIDEIDLALTVRLPKNHPEIINIGLPSETVSGLTEPNHAGGAFPRPDLHERLDRVLAKSKPDLIVACYGMNDGIYYPLSEERFKAYRDGIMKLRDKVKAAGAKLWIMTPPTFDSLPIKSSTLPAGRDVYPSGQSYEGYDDVLAAYSRWLMSLRKRGWNVVDVHTALRTYIDERRKTEPNFTFAGDGVHPNEVGQHLIAKELLRAWKLPQNSWNNAQETVRRLIHDRQSTVRDAWLSDVGHKRPGMPKGISVEEASRMAKEIDKTIELTIVRAAIGPRRFAGKESLYHDFRRHDFVIDGCDAIVVEPETVARGRPWIWRAEFFDHRPEADLALLKRGFHLFYIQVGNTYGCPSAMAHWDAAYKDLTTKYDLSKQPALEGLSRGGLYVYNWASRHPKSVSCIYGDAPVCDIKSWPGGKGKGPGSPDDWASLQKLYGFKSEEEALAFRGNPIDRLKPLADAHVPLLHVCGDADEVVPYEENTVVLKERYEKLGGKIEVIVKPGGKHHPHALDDPTPIVEFVLRHTR